MQKRDRGISELEVDDLVSALVPEEEDTLSHSGSASKTDNCGPTRPSDGAMIPASDEGAETRAVSVDMPRTTPRKSQVPSLSLRNLPWDTPTCFAHPSFCTFPLFPLGISPTFPFHSSP